MICEKVGQLDVDVVLSSLSSTQLNEWAAHIMLQTPGYKPPQTEEQVKDAIASFAATLNQKPK